MKGVVVALAALLALVTLVNAASIGHCELCKFLVGIGSRNPEFYKSRVINICHLLPEKLQDRCNVYGQIYELQRGVQ
eukprot:CAMPEP_0177662606 /NCGR_PEP_ID=MMETSP0447-20121125/19400_1 /TAXON_ID=0 /ORGANISM="Stygamoeba regulata, Strain BSH-02190019" /LENGTH=76 /DNA_ID=CAMNT_0019168223 /DNA_START=94 /DNA_END=324 /DNA_ORIENTATION=-